MNFHRAPSYSPRPKSNPTRGRNGAGDDKNRDAILAHHRQTQDALSNDLLLMAQALKSNALNFGQLLEKDRKVREFAQASWRLRET